MTGESAFVRALRVSDVPPGAKKAVEIAGQSILICNAESGLVAVSNLCSHQNERLECGRLSKKAITCPVHGTRFDLTTGRAMNPPATKPIKIYPVRLVDDWIEVEV